MAKLHYIRGTLKQVEREIGDRGYKNDPVITGLATVVKQLLKEVEKLTEKEEQEQRKLMEGVIKELKLLSINGEHGNISNTSVPEDRKMNMETRRNWF